MEEIIGFFMTALVPLQTLIETLLERVPLLLGVFLLLFLGAFVGHWVRVGLDRALRIVDVDGYARRIGMDRILARLGLGTSFVTLMGVVLHAMIVVSCLIASIDALGMTAVTEYLRRVVMFIPKFLSVILILGGGFFIGSIAGHIVHRAAEANHVRASGFLSKAAFGIMVLFAGIIALDLLGITMDILMGSIHIIVAAIGLGLAIAFGLAGRSSAEKWLEDLNPRSLTGNGSMPAPKERLKVH